jgi:hypothetical protein
MKKLRVVDGVFVDFNPFDTKLLSKTDKIYTVLDDTDSRGFRVLSETEERDFRAWALEHRHADIQPIYHPAVQDELISLHYKPIHTDYCSLILLTRLVSECRELIDASGLEGTGVGAGWAVYDPLLQDLRDIVRDAEKHIASCDC